MDLTKPNARHDLSELEQYASTLMIDAAREVNYQTIREMAPDHLGRTLNPAERNRVDELITTANITVEFPKRGAGA